MQTLVSIQHWLYGGMSKGLGEVAGGDLSAILFGAVHALMPGHGKTVLVVLSPGPTGSLDRGFVKWDLAVTHVGLAVVLVLAGFGDQPRLRLWRQDTAIRDRQRDIDRADRPFSGVAHARP